MRMRRSLHTVFGVVAALALLTACGDDGGSAPSGSGTTSVNGAKTTYPAVSSGVRDATGRGPSIASPPAPGQRPAAPEPAPAQQPPGVPPVADPPPAYGTAVIRTQTLSGVGVPDVPVHMRLVQPCDPAGHDIPVGETTEVLRRDGVTDATGVTSFQVPVGCYFFGMDPPPGTTPVPEGMHSLFITRAGETVAGTLRFEEPGLPSSCAAETIEHDLGVGPDLANASATVTECDGRWAIISWDVPGDSQRLVRHDGTVWTGYVSFPHEICWSRAMADGVPARFQRYFPGC
ncbi:hypothetical protein [Nocardia cyriacigeorgica]|uniref:hypothetical protein n=1 Tax=Nocardia cyriacigeorgica TaxID=135487 RepID=UPI001C49C962|nr:hypothetical protein [Nocardia cyriacigeorgica]